LLRTAALHTIGDDIAGPGAYWAPTQQRGMHLLRPALGLAAASLLAVLFGCAPSYSPNTYDAVAVQQANAVERGVVIGVRAVKVSANAAVGTVTGAAAGGIAGSTVGDSGPIKALSALGGSVVGGLVGSGVQHAEGDTNAFEYIVRESNNNLVSVTQRDKVPLPIGERVLVIAGKQARIVADYTVSLPDPQPSAKVTPDTKSRPSDAQAVAGTATVVPQSTAASVGAAAQILAASHPSSSPATTAGGSNGHAAPAGGGAASSVSAAAIAAVLAAPLGDTGNPAAAATEPGQPVPAGTAGAAPPASAGGGTAASTAAGKTTAPDPP
jgi:outer membrane lipoprotein SlyB